MAHILIVDDEKSIRHTLGEFLRVEGHAVVEAEDADVARQRLAEVEFDVVVTDIVLPRVSGVELLHHIHATAPGVQVVMMTGEPTVETAANSLRAGAVDYLFKPIGKTAIVRVVANAVRIKRLEDTRRRLEEENRVHRENLEKLVAERTAQLVVSEQKYRLLFETSRDAMMTISSSSWRFTSGNPAAIAMFRARDEAAFVSKGPWDVSPEYQADGRRSDEKIREMNETAMSAGSHFFEWTHQRLDGEVFPATVLLTRFELAGRPILQATVRDITEQKHAEAERTLLATAMEQAAESIVITDAQGTIQYVNPAFTRATGYTQQEALGRNPRVLKSGKHNAGFYQQMWDSLARGEVWHGHIINRKKDGGIFEEEATISPVRNAAGHITNYVAVKRDVTREVQLEHQFLQAQKMEAIGRLAGGVAHDFNNLLTVICGFSDILLNNQAIQGQPRDLLVEIRKAGERAASLTQQLLTFSRKQVVQPQILDLNAQLADLQKILKRVIGEDIELVVKTDPDLYRIKIDPGQLGQIIMNLTINARDAMAQGGKLGFVTRNVELDEAFTLNHPRAQPGSYVLLEINDNGCGMSSEVKARIFEPFFTTKEEGKGTGLGLATVYAIVEQARGFITVESSPGKGTTFRIYLPREGNLSTARAGQPSGTLPRGQETILLVEDDLGVRTLVGMILRRAGYKVLEAENGTQALEIAGKKSVPIQLLLTDVVMPGTSGRNLADQMVSLRPSTRILYMSGYLDDAVVRHGILESELAFLQKPFTQDTLLRKVREVLDGN